MYIKNNFEIKWHFLIFLSFLFVSCSSIKTLSNVKNFKQKNLQDGLQTKIKENEKLGLKLNDIKNFKIRPGEVTLVKRYIKKNLTAVNLRCGKKDIPYSYNRKKHTILFIVSESYFSKRKSFSCKILNSKLKKIDQIEFSVVSKKYPEEKLNVDKKRVVLSQKNIKRYLKEKKILIKAYTTATKVIQFDQPFVAPLFSKVTSIYGTKRLFNHMKKTQHLGTDYRAKVGTRIPAVNNGIIVFAGDLFFTGGTVIINHGLNIFSIYGHLSKLKVKKGDHVSRGEIVALSGKSGRVTGPHLHWGVKVLGQYISGPSLIEQSSSINE